MGHSKKLASYPEEFRSSLVFTKSLQNKRKKELYAIRLPGETSESSWKLDRLAGQAVLRNGANSAASGSHHKQPKQPKHQMLICPASCLQVAMALLPRVSRRTYLRSMTNEQTPMPRRKADIAAKLQKKKKGP